VKRPASVDIMGHKVRILPMPEQGDEKIVGFVDTSREIIYVSTALSDGAWDEVLLHEVVHYISDTSGKELTEDQVKGMSNGLFNSGIRIGRGK
jgi:hypothetical protein